MCNQDCCWAGERSWARLQTNVEIWLADGRYDRRDMTIAMIRLTNWLKLKT